MNRLTTVPKIALYLLTILFSATGLANAQEVVSATGPHIKVELLSEKAHFVAGENKLGIYLQPDEHWHTYWRNPGDSGEAPKLVWTLPEGVTAGKITWPVPQKINVAHLVNYGYEGAVLLIVPIFIPNQYVDQSERINLRLDVSWLVCKEDCIPGWATFSLDRKVGFSSSTSEHAPLFEQAKNQLPAEQTIPARHEITDQHIVVSLSRSASEGSTLLPYENGVIAHNGKQTLLRTEDDTSTFLLPKSEYLQATPEKLSLLLTDGKTGYEVHSQLNLGNDQDNQTDNLFTLMMMALVGGLILNLMPCVLPILAIKAMSMQQTAHGLIDKLAYFAGVVVCFNLFALVIILFRNSGEAVGWGFHMQEPVMVALLAFLFVYITLFLLNVAPQGNRLTSLGQVGPQASTKFSQFMTGVLAVVVASPCTAPFMAAALGVAFVSPTPIVFLLFSSLALGFAIPLTLLFFVPRLSAWIPKPGPWMENMRQFLAFPMMATVIWLSWLFVQQSGANAQLGLLTGLLLFSMSLWVANKTKGVKSGLAYLFALISVLFSIMNSSGKPTETSKAALPFNQEKLSQLKNDNQVIMVNMTADWCITCKVNEQVALDTETVQAVFEDQSVQYMEGDWTNKNREILTYLNQYQRAGVPLYVVYAGNKSHQVLPQILTPDIIINAIQKAKQEINYEH